MTDSAPRFSGEVVFLYAFDIAYDMWRTPIPTLLGTPVERFSVETDKRLPRDLFFYQPNIVRLPTVERTGPHGRITVQRSIKIFSVGAISVCFRVPFTERTLAELVTYHDLRFAEGSLHEEVAALADVARRELAAFSIRPTAVLRDEEAYTVFCLDAPATPVGQAAFDAEKWLHKHRFSVAGLLNQETDIEALSDQESQQTVANYLSYYDFDLVLADWDAALVIDRRERFTDVLHILELATVQLTELAAFDRMLDDAIERSYPDLRGNGFRRGGVLRGLRELRIDLSRLSDELSNTTKFFGDWHAARVYQAVAGKFHLADWHRAIDEKLAMLDSLYHLLKQDTNERWMLSLEIMVVVLFIIDLVIISVLGAK